MPRHPHISHLHSILADAIGAQGRTYTQTYPQMRNVPHKLVRGLIRGLLTYFSMPSRRCGAEQIHLDTLEMWLLAWIEEKTNHNTTSSTRHKSTYTNEEVNRIADSVPEVVTVLLQHPSPLILKHESEWLTQELAEYATLPNDSRKHLKWVQKHLPRILSGLLRVTRCPRLECPRRTTVPDRNELDTWTGRSGSGVRALTFHILAHYHDSTYATVKRLLQSRSSR